MSISALICSSDKHSCVSAYLIQGLSAHTDDIQCCLGVWTVAACERHTHTQEMIIPFLFDTTLLRAQSPTAANTLTVVFDAVCVDESDI